jgi:hypothetical protein
VCGPVTEQGIGRTRIKQERKELYKRILKLLQHNIRMDLTRVTKHIFEKGRPRRRLVDNIKMILT